MDEDEDNALYDRLRNLDPAVLQEIEQYDSNWSEVFTQDLYTEQRLAMKAELNRELIDLSNCYSCVVAKKKREGVMESKEGKDPLSFPAYKKIAERCVLRFTTIFF